jgi:hypothetical protein
MMVNQWQLAYAMNIETRSDVREKYRLILSELERDVDFCWRPEKFQKEIMFLLDMRSAALHQMALNDFMAEG